MAEQTLGGLSAAGSLVIGDGYRTKRPEHGRPGYRILRVADIADGRVSLTGDDFVREEYIHVIGAKLSQPDDVLLTTKGTVGRVAIYPRDAERVVYSPQLCFFRVVDSTVLSPRYLAYWFKSGDFLGQAAHRSNNTDMAAYINLRDIHSLELRLPSMGVQRAIAEVLGALDDKIAANNRVIDKSQELMLAHGQEVTEQAKMAELARQSTASVKPQEFEAEVAHFSLPAFDEGAIPDSATGDSIKSNKFLLSAPCVLMSKLNPRIPRIWDVPVLPGLQSLASTEFVVLLPIGLDASVLWSVLSQPSVSADLTAKVAGTSGSHQRFRPVEQLELKIGDARTLRDSARQSIADLGRLVQSMRAESVALATTRDELLPLLMSGKLRVKDAEGVVSDAL